MYKTMKTRGKRRYGLRALLLILITAALTVSDITPVFALKGGDDAAYTLITDAVAEPEYDMEAADDTGLAEEAPDIITNEENLYADDENGTDKLSGEQCFADKAGGVIQEGEFPEKAGEASVGLVPAEGGSDSYDGAISKIAGAAKNWDGNSKTISIDISSYGIMRSGISDVVTSVINRNPELFYIASRYVYYMDGQERITKLELGVKDGYSLADVRNFNTVSEKILGEINTSWTDHQKLIYIHDYLVTHINYDKTLTKRDVYTALVGGSCVCQGYALAFAYLANRVNPGFDCTVVTSNGINHAWNMVTLNGVKYYVDATWDDPSNQYEFYNRYDNCLISKSRLINTGHTSSDWKDSYGNTIYGTVTGSDLDNVAWKDMNSTMPMFGTKGVYYSGYNTMKIYTYDFTTKTSTSIKQYSNVIWYQWNSRSYWTDNFSYLGKADDNIVITVPGKIYVINQSGSDVTSYSSKSSGGYIYGGRIDGNTLYYDVYTNPPCTSDSTYIGRYSQTVGSAALPVAVTGVSVNPATLSLKLKTGETVTGVLKESVVPSNAANRKVNWSSSNTAVATVDQSGKVTAVSAGTADITVTTVDGGKKAECKVTVLEADPVKVDVTGVTLSPSTLTLKMGATETGTLKAAVLPSDATNKSIMWGSGNSAIASVSARGLVTAKGPGTVNITVTTVDGGKKAVCKVTVLEADPVKVAVTGVTINPTSLKLKMGVTETGTLSASVIPANATDRNITWSSGNAAVATVDSKGNVKAKAAGRTTVTVKTEDGGFTADCVVTVEKADQVTPDNPTNPDDPTNPDNPTNPDDPTKPDDPVNPDNPDDPDTDPALTVKAVEDVLYNGYAQKPMPDVYYGDKKLVFSVDYTLVYKNNLNVAEKTDAKAPSVTVKFRKNYAGSRTVKFSVKQADISGAQINPVFGYSKYDEKTGAYTTKKLSPGLTYNGKKLVKNKDYTLIYTDKSEGAYAKPGTYGITIEGKGNFKGTSYTSEILAEDVDRVIDLKKVSVIPADGNGNYTYTGNEIRPAYSLKDKKSGEYLSENDYYTVYSNNVNPGTAKVTFVAKGGRTTGLLTRKFKIDKASFADKSPDIEVEGGVDRIYEKGGVKPSVTVKWGGRLLVQGVDYKLGYTGYNIVSTPNKKSGIVVTGMGNYKDKYTLPYNIGQQDIGLMNVQADDYVYLSKANAYKKTKIYVYDLNGKALSTSDYSKISWQIDPGGKGNDADRQKGIAQPGDTVKFVIRGKGKYYGTISGTFKILENPAYSLSGATVSFKTGGRAKYDPQKNVFEYRGKAVEPDKGNLSIGMTTEDGRTVYLTGSDYEIVNYENNLNKGTAKMTLRGKGRYAGLKVVSFKIISAR